MADYDVEICCLEATYCRLCRFPLEDGELVVAAIRDGRLSATFLFHYDDIFEDEHQGVAIRLCCMDFLPRLRRPLPCFHEDCYGFRPLPITAKFLAATKHQFNPPIREWTRRRRHIQRAFAARLGQGILNRLPYETCNLVAGHLVRECAIVAAQEMALNASSADSVIELSRDIYTQYICIDDVRYIQFLSNAPPSEVKGGIQVFKPRQGRVITSIYIRCDHLGVRGLYFDLPQGQLLESPSSGVWWTELHRKNGILRLTAKTDGLKIRHLLDFTDAALTPDRTMPTLSWPTPGLDCRIINLETCQIVQDVSQEGLRSLRMSSMDCNAPGTKGYFAAMHGYHVPRIYVHHPAADPPYPVKQDRILGEMLYVYMPIDQDEYLKEVWAIRHPVYGSIALMLLSSSGRAVMFGIYLNHPALEFHRIYVTSDRPSRLYFNEWDPENPSWINFLGLDNAETGNSVSSGARNTRSHTYPPSLIPTSLPPDTRSTELWYYTTCRMENVDEIICCVDETDVYKPIIGMMLCYTDGRRSCLGQYRPDWAAAPLRIDPAKILRIGMSKMLNWFPYVAEVGQHGGADLRWVDIPWHGRLEWWFSPRKTLLRHSN